MKQTIEFTRQISVSWQGVSPPPFSLLLSVVDFCPSGVWPAQHLQADPSLSFCMYSSLYSKHYSWPLRDLLSIKEQVPWCWSWAIITGSLRLDSITGVLLGQIEPAGAGYSGLCPVWFQKSPEVETQQPLSVFVLVFDHSHSEMFSCLHLFQFVPTASYFLSGYHWEEPISLFFTLSRQKFICTEIPPKPSLP